MTQKPTIQDSNQQDQFTEKNEFFNIIYSRKSTRKYLGIPVEWDKITKIVDAARVGPSAGNLQPVRTIIVQDQKKRTQISESCLSQHWMSSAPVHIIITTNPEHPERYYGEKGKQKYALQDASMAGMTMMLAATALKLGSCWISLFNEEKIKETLDIRPEVDVHGIITIGYSADKEKKTIKKRIGDVTSIESSGPHFANFSKPFDLEYRFKERIPKYIKKTYEDFKNIREHKKTQQDPNQQEGIIKKIKNKLKKNKK